MNDAVGLEQRLLFQGDRVAQLWPYCSLGGTQRRLQAGLVAIEAMLDVQL